MIVYSYEHNDKCNSRSQLFNITVSRSNMVFHITDINKPSNVNSKLIFT